MGFPVVRHISKSIVTPNRNAGEDSKRCDLTPWDLAMLSVHYIQKGLLFYNPPLSSSNGDGGGEWIVERLKDSLSEVLVQFYPLAGRFAADKDSSSSASGSINVFIDCNNAGVEFIHASVDTTVADVLQPIDVPQIVQSFFTLDRAVNYDGHSLPLLSVQFTQLIDGVFVGCSCNHAVADGTSFWNFLNAWSEISRTKGTENYNGTHQHQIQSSSSSSSSDRIIITQRCFLDVDKSLVRLPYSTPDQFIERYTAPALRERIFHFTAKVIARLKEKANYESKSHTISSFQALGAHVWRCITRARCFTNADQKTSCKLAAGNRPRLQPPLSSNYFGNCINTVTAATTVGELLSNDLGWAAMLLHKSVAAHTDSAVRGAIKAWVRAPSVYHLSGFDRYSVMIGSSPRFDVYGNDFGWGKPVAVRSGYASKYDGKITSYPGQEGGGSIDLEVCLPPHSMGLLESDKEFMDSASTF